MGSHAIGRRLVDTGNCRLTPMRVEHSLRPNYLVIAVTILGVLIIGSDRIGIMPSLHAVTDTLYTWVILLAAFALLLGVVNVIWIHVRRILVGRPDRHDSLALVVTLLVVFVSGLLSPAGARSPLVEWVFDAIIAPGQATLFSLLAFFMAAAAYRFLRIGRTGGAWMLAGMLLILLVEAPLGHAVLPPAIATLAGWTLDVPGMAALRGALLGSSFALIVVGLRFLFSAK